MAFIPVRPHFYVGAALLALGAILAALTAARRNPLAPDAHLVALLGGLTLFAQGIAFWYTPSFAKREVVLDGMAAYSGPILFPAALVAGALRVGNFQATLVGLALVLFGTILLASAFAGPKWRGGVPFWRSDSPHRAGDRAAAFTLASACLWLLLAGIAAYVRPQALASVWPIALAVFALGALAHLLPRARGRPLSPASFVAAVALLQLDALVMFLQGRALPPALLVGLPLAGAALALPLGGKPAGSRLREARTLLLAALPIAALVPLLALVEPRAGLGATLASYYALLTAAALGLGGLSLLTLPVLFNQRPAPRYLAPAAASAAAGALLLAAGFLTRLPRWPGAVLLGLALLLWLAALAPLRKPRRDCAMDRIPS